MADDFPGNASSSPRSLVRYHAQSVGNCSYSLLRVFSFFCSVYIFRIRAPKGMQHYLYDLRKQTAGMGEKNGLAS